MCIYIYICVCARMFGLYIYIIYLLIFAHETWPTFETRWFGKVQFLETFFQRGLILFMASWLSHAPNSPKPKFAKNKRHFKIFKEWNFGNLGHPDRARSNFPGVSQFLINSQHFDFCMKRRRSQGQKWTNLPSLLPTNP